MKKTKYLKIILSMLFILSTLVFTSCTTAYSPFSKGLFFYEIEGGYMVQPMPVATSLKGIAKKLLLTTSLDIPSSYLGKPVVGIKGFSAYHRLTKVTIPDTVRYIETGAFGDSVHYNEYGNALYLGNKDNPYIALMRPKNNSITSLTIHEDTKVIAEYAFSECTSLQDVYYNGGIEKWLNISFCSNPISNAKFYMNQELVTEVVIPDSITEINANAFWGCDSLTKVTIPNSVTKIGESAFDGCTSLQSVTIPDSVTEIDDWAFHYCPSLRSITIPNSVTRIGEDAFSSCSYLESINIPNSITRIESSAFMHCKSLTSVTIPSSVVFIDEAAFNHCTSLKSIYFNGTIKQWRDIEKHPQWYYNIPATKAICSDGADTLLYNYISGESEIVNKGDYLFYITGGVNYLLGYTGSDTNLILPDDYNGESYNIHPGAFSDRDDLTSVVIPDNVTIIGQYAFEGCKSLASVVIGDKVTSISGFAFRDCYKLVEVINKSSLDITAGSSDYGYVAEYAIEVHNGESKMVNKDDYLFYTYNGVNYLIGYIGDDTSLSLTDNYNGESYEIYDRAFRDCSSLTSIVIPDSVTSIGDYAFSGCTSLTSIVIPDSVTSIDDGAFYDCRSLTSVYITDMDAWCNISFSGSVSNPIYYGADLYLNGELLTELIIPDTVTMINNYAFCNYASLTSIEIPNGMTSIGSSAFSGCTSLTSIEIPNGVTSIGSYAFAGCSSLTSIEIPDGVTVIDWCAFFGCTSLTSIAIPDGVTSIDGEAFRDCSSLTSIEIPNSVTSIGYDAFCGCSSLTSIKYRGTEEQWNAISKYYDLQYNTDNYTITYNYTGE